MLANSAAADMHWKNVKLIFGREVRDQLRDRRTLFMILVLPLLLYPALGFGLVQMTVFFTQERRQVGVVGSEYLPEEPALLNSNKTRFAAQWFANPEEAEQLAVLLGPLDRQAVESGEVQVLVEFPPNAREELAAGNQIEPVVTRNTADEKSLFTYGRVMEILSEWKVAIGRHWLESRQLPAGLLDPVKPREQDIAPPEQQTTSVWSKLFPFLLVIMSLTGAFYPAVDLCAGEKERGTMETLLISPAARGEIVLGKYLTIFIFSVATALLNLASMGLTGWWLASLTAQATGELAEKTAALALPGLSSAIWIVVLLLPLSAFFSALCLALAAFARSSKEGQYYLMPLYLVTMPLTMLTVAPGVELTAFYSVVPVTGVALLLKALLLAQYDVARAFFLPVLLPTIFYSLLALRWAIDQFKREDVLFREAERFEVGLWMRHLLRDKRPTPSGGEAIFCFALMMLLMWFSLPFFQSEAQPNGAPAVDLVRAIAVQQLAFIAAPALLMAVILTSSPLRTLRLAPPSSWAMAALAVVLAVACHPLVLEVSHWVQRLLPISEKVNEAFSLIFRMNLGTQLLVVAALPAVCEELAFRGFILSGLLRGHRVWSAVLVSAFLFGIFHMFLQQMFTAILLGIVLGLLVVRTGSLLPAALFHFTNNALTVLLDWLNTEQIQESSVLRLLLRTDGEAGYRMPIVLLAALVAGAILVWLMTGLRRSSPSSGEPADAARQEAAVHSGV